MDTGSTGPHHLDKREVRSHRREVWDPPLAWEEFVTEVDDIHVTEQFKQWNHSFLVRKPQMYCGRLLQFLNSAAGRIDEDKVA